MNHETKAIKTLLLLFIVSIFTAAFSGCSTPRHPEALKTAQEAMPPCDGAPLPELPDVTLTSVTDETQPVPHCKVAGVIGPEIHFELLLPANWNGKFVMGGGGGFVGSVMNTSLMFGALRAGYATVGTDTGHQGHPLDGSWAYNNLERLVNFGHQAVHRTAVTAKALTKAYYQKEIDRSYFTGCSRGGGQAFMEAQRYPEDFDGIVSGAPAYNWTALAALTSQINQAMYPDPDNLQEAVVGPKEQELIESSYLEMCDELDGIKDGIVNDPRQCAFDVATLLCKGEKTEKCLSADQLAAVKVIYDGPKDSKGNPLFYGFPFGGETALGGWPRWLTGGLNYQEDLAGFQGGVAAGDFKQPLTPSAFYAFGNGIMKYFIYNDPDWSYVNYDYDTLTEDSKRIGETLNSTSPDLSAFRKRGGKLIIYSGWSDAAVPADAVIGYYEDVLTHDKTAAEDVRLFMMPGTEHCFGGPGPSWVNWLDEIDKWVETGTAPDQVAAYWLDENMQPEGSRLLCAYPQVAEYDTEGGTRDVSSFGCGGDK
ncbi:putative esterase [Desulfoluna limicola]|uniref:Esterase n=1 Tax=Desulfoluna limicola TaxID=2810562 RepID=A0ABN6F0Z7_9BACT|nr:tannase/feruloyl esterase family alpha/beta hydrolase [Desulfoluna limicola]BCS95280.1 putative esterase [Desulfoluna limicola]